MKKAGLCLLILYAFLEISFAQSNKEEAVFLYSYFKGNGEDGLHLAYSLDGYHWKALNEDRSFLSPQSGEDKLMRDPCIIRGRDGKFHMVYFDKYKAHKMGAVASLDLKNWTDISDKISFPKGTRHGTVFKVTMGELEKLKSL